MADLVLFCLMVSFGCLLILQMMILRTLRSLEEALRGKIPSAVMTNKHTFALESFTEMSARRAKLRAPTALEADLVIEGVTVKVSVHDLSETGALLQGTDSNVIKKGSSYPITFHLTSGIEIKARVRAIRKQEDAFWGVCFEDLSIENRKHIREYVSTNFSAGLHGDISPIS